jgi:hypothetical protein
MAFSYLVGGSLIFLASYRGYSLFDSIFHKDERKYEACYKEATKAQRNILYRINDPKEKRKFESEFQDRVRIYMDRYCYNNYTAPESGEEYNDYYDGQKSEGEEQEFFDFGILRSIKNFFFDFLFDIPFKFYRVARNICKEVTDEIPQINEINKIIDHEKREKILFVIINIMKHIPEFKANLKLASILMLIYLCITFLLLSNILSLFNNPAYIKKIFIVKNIVFVICFMIYLGKQNFYIDFFKNDNLVKSSIFFCVTMLSIIMPNDRTICFFLNTILILSNFLMISANIQI